MKKILNFAWGIVYRRWLWNSYFNDHDSVVEVKGWRTALVEDKARRRSRISPCFLWFRAAVFLPLVLLCIPHVQAATYTITTATLTITNAVNLTGTNGAAITVVADTRTWTNGVINPATEILCGDTTNIVTVASRLVTHLSTYPFASLKLLASGTTGVKLVGQSNATVTVSLTETNWGAVSYVTNTYSASQGIVRVPNTIESDTTRTNIGNGLIDWVNQAHTTTELDQTAAALAQLVGLANTQTVVGEKTFSDANNSYTGADATISGEVSYGNLKGAHTALSVDNSATNFWPSFTPSGFLTVTATNDIFFQASTNRATVRKLTIRIDPNGSTRNLGFNSDWTFISSTPTTIATGSIGLVTLWVFGTAETDVIARYSIEGGTGLTSLNGETGGTQTFAAGSAGADFAITSAANTHTFDLPTASGANRGALASADFTTFSGKADTANETWTGTHDFSGATDFEIPNGAAPTVNAFGELAGDNDQWAASRGAPVFFDGTEQVALIGTVATNTPSNGYVPKWQTGGTILWQVDNTGGTITGTDTHVMFFDGADTPAGEAGFTYNKTTDSATLVGTLTANALALTQSALAVNDSGTNFVADISGAAYRLITATNDVNFSFATNTAAGKGISILIDANGSDRNLSIPSTWFRRGVDSVVTNGTLVVLSLYGYGADNTNIVASSSYFTK